LRGGEDLLKRKTLRWESPKSTESRRTKKVLKALGEVGKLALTIVHESLMSSQWRGTLI
jgi:hypothetical protein